MSTGIYCHETQEFWPTMKIATKDLGVHNIALWEYFSGKSPACLDGLTLVKVKEIFCEKCGCLLTEHNHPKWEEWRICKDCKSDMHRKYNHREQYREQQKDNARVRLYGMPYGAYDEMFNEQGGRCLICGRHQNEFKKSLNVDHNHKTGKIRGLLCSICNAKLGWFEKYSDKISSYLEDK